MSDAPEGIIHDVLKLEPFILDAKRGYNPYLAHCYFCGKPTGQLICLGYVVGDEPIGDLTLGPSQPCLHCQMQMEVGILCLSVRKGLGGLHRTGRLMVVDDTLVDDYAENDQYDRIMKRRWCAISDDLFERILREQLTEQIEYETGDFVWVAPPSYCGEDTGKGWVVEIDNHRMLVLSEDVLSPGGGMRNLYIGKHDWHRRVRRLKPEVPVESGR